jgi:eukaryotic-like serine/threonine-protein kinase
MPESIAAVMEADGSPSDFLTNERVEGELLAARLARGPLPADEALRCAIALGTVLHRAHARGLVHGRLSPQAVILAGREVRLLHQSREAGERSPGYRAPEQVRGQAADSRSDIFAFGALLYEMATGRRAFSGEGDDLASAILAGGAAAPAPKTPAYTAVEAVIAGCLERNPQARRQRIQNAVSELKFARASLARAAAESAAQAEGALGLGARTRKGGPQNWFLRRGWVLGLIFLAVAATAVAAVLYFRHRPEEVSVAFRVEPPQNTEYPGTPAVSPDGAFLTFSAAGPEGHRMLWLRPLGSLRPTPISGTEGGSAPFWSPDGRYIAFFAGEALKRVPRDGGKAETICPAQASAGGGTWNRDDIIVFAPGLSGDLMRVPAMPGSRPQPLLRVHADLFQTAFLWPQFLPDQKHFLFFVQADLSKVAGVYAGSLTSPDYQRLFGSETNAVFSPADAKSDDSGYLLFMHDRTLMGQVFDAGKLEVSGDPIALVDDIGSLGSVNLAPISVSANGVLVCQAVSKVTRQMVWTDRAGKRVAAVKDVGGWGEPRISPDGKRALAAKLGPDGENADLWILDSEGNATQFGNTPVHEGSPVWSPDGSRVVFFQFGAAVGNFDVYVEPASGAAKPEILFRSEFPKYPTDWSRDGRYVFFTTLTAGTKSDVWALSMSDRHAGAVLGTVNNEGYAALSPDGRWLAFQSDESGRNEVWVMRFEGIDWSPRRHWQVSQGGGGRPRWRADGKELFFVTPTGRMMAAAVHTEGNEFQCDSPTPLFQTHPLPKTWNLYDVSPDGQRFLVNLPLEITSSNSISVFTNWTERLRQQSGTRE